MVQTQGLVFAMWSISPLPASWIYDFMLLQYYKNVNLHHKSVALCVVPIQKVSEESRTNNGAYHVVPYSRRLIKSRAGLNSTMVGEFTLTVS